MLVSLGIYRGMVGRSVLTCRDVRRMKRGHSREMQIHGGYLSCSYPVSAGCRFSKMGESSGFQGCIVLFRGIYPVWRASLRLALLEAED